MKSDKLPKVMSLESTSVGSDCESENEKNLGVAWSWKEVSLPDLCSSSSPLTEDSSSRLH